MARLFSALHFPWWLDLFACDLLGKQDFQPHADRCALAMLVWRDYNIPA
jgi:hypothetical protein